MACMGSLLFKMGKERGGEMGKNIPRSAVTAWAVWMLWFMVSSAHLAGPLMSQRMTIW